jgi:mono/diheme cytochrome c family protein
MVVRSAIAAAVALLLAITAGSARADVAAGQRLAVQWCASCHVVAAGGSAASVPQGPPTFRSVAGRLDAAQIRTFLSHPHGGMPDLALSRAEIEDLIAYIESLR